MKIMKYDITKNPRFSNLIKYERIRPIKRQSQNSISMSQELFPISDLPVLNKKPLKPV
jgi:hypothetical protein